MSVRPGNNRRWILIVVRLVLGTAFVYAGALKIADPLQFADSIASFQILPNPLVVPLALSLPIFEIITGLLLITGWMRHAASLGILSISIAFTLAVGFALARGLTIDCGCFGSAMPSRTRMWLELGRDFILVVAAAAVYSFPPSLRPGNIINNGGSSYRQRA